MVEKVSLDTCREMLVKTAEQFEVVVWKEMFTAWLEENGWGYDEFCFAMATEYKQLTGQDWTWLRK